MSKKFHVTCVLENASLLINGVAFVQVDKETVMTADPVEADVAVMFDGIPGYALMELSEEDESALEAARELEAKARSRAAQSAKTAAAAAREAVKAAKAAAPAPEPEPVTEPTAAADEGNGEGASEGEGTDQGAAGEGAETAKPEGEEEVF